MKDKKTGQKVLVRQVRSISCRNTRTQRMLQAVGLGKIGKEKVHTINPAVAGMLAKLHHLVTVEDIKA